MPCFDRLSQSGQFFGSYSRSGCRLGIEFGQLGKVEHHILGMCMFVDDVSSLVVYEVLLLTLCCNCVDKHAVSWQIPVLDIC